MPWDDDLDAVSILVPADIIGMPGLLKSITAGGVELTEDPSPAWASGTTYAIGDRAHDPVAHRVYESIQGGNQGKNPAVLSNQFTASGVSTWWLDIGPTNRYAMFDSMVSSQTSAASPLVITLAPGAFNGFAVFGTNADSFTGEARTAPGGDLTYSEHDKRLDGLLPPDYYEYFFDRAKPITQFVRTGIDPYGAAEFKLTLEKATGNVKVGMLAIGDMRNCGVPQRDANIEPQDFSYFKQDAYGNATVKKRPNGTGMSITAKMEKEDANVVLDTVKEVLGVPCVVVGSAAQNYEWMTVFGLISGSMSPAEYPLVTLKLTVKGFI